MGIKAATSVPSRDRQRKQGQTAAVLRWHPPVLAALMACTLAQGRKKLTEQVW
jgi:hypothetical protein